MHGQVPDITVVTHLLVFLDTFMLQVYLSALMLEPYRSKEHFNGTILQLEAEYL